ncbi:alpha/beta fold hydrolase [Neiella sp. HB171785]|uniref:Alpha/beta fold hydrolase n=1 Tax=Neiella litorisoli TaxID=2771431 RepID=A0A8J6R4A6_9GAMM|nr:alpha/beta fold hydrolase [Neiella litorisoli]MBD1391345.1 alpha/beta fold hydrolase [Neiella litorisoli]
MPQHLHAELIGAPVSADRPVVVMLHGFLGQHQDWLAVVAPWLQQHSFLLVDLPNHGNSPTTTRSHSGFQQWLQLFANTLAHHGVEHYLLMGYSMGARLAMATAATQPAGLRGILLESGHPGDIRWNKRLARHRWHQRWQARWLTQPKLQSLQQWYQQGVFADLSRPQRQQQIHRRLLTIKPWRLASTLAQLSLDQQDDYWSLLACDRSKADSLQAMPIHYLAGGQDRKYAKLAEKMKQTGLPVRVHLLKHAGHNIHAHQPRQWQQCFQLWLQDCLPQGLIHAR